MTLNFKSAARAAAAAAVALAMGLAIGAADAKDWKKIRVGTEGAYPPFNFIDSDGKLKGFDVEIANALCEKMKAECSLVAQDWDGIIPGLLAKKYDAIVASMTITAERMKRVSFTDKYYNTPAKWMKQKDKALDDVTREGFKGLTLGAQKATTSSNYLEDVYKGVADIKLYDTQEQANLDLKAGRLDAVVADKLVALDWLNSDDGGCCGFFGPDLTDPNWFGYGIGIAVRQGDNDLREQMNKALAEILADGTYEKINAKYFPFSIY